MCPVAYQFVIAIVVLEILFAKSTWSNTAKMFTDSDWYGRIVLWYVRIDY